ncbi:MAG: ATPase, T2SS/T4P/T4SS family [Myxococcales bacterium]|nr:ATPase, T2SS/T4P/T4SS family [Myxococcales bacterium]
MSIAVGTTGLSEGGEPRVELVVRRGNTLLDRVELSQGAVITVGREDRCTLALQDVSVSRRHLSLQARLDGVWVEDQSTNGTLVGDQSVHGDGSLATFGTRIRVGSIDLWVRRPRRAGNNGAAKDASANGVRTEEPASGESPSASASQGAAGPSNHLQDGDDALSGLRKRVHRQLLEQLDMTAIDPGKNDDPTLRPRVLSALRRIVAGLAEELPGGLTREALVGQMADEALGLGPLEGLIADGGISEIMVLDAHHIYVERSGRVELSPYRFTDDERVRAVIERIVTPLGRRVDESSPLVDARLMDGSRVNVVIRPVALRGSCITIRKFAAKPFSLSDLCELGTLSEAMGRFLVRSVQAKKNIVISGGTGSGKTTLLNVLSGAIPSDERIVTIEDAAELVLAQPHVVGLEARPANMEGKGEIPIRMLVKNALRMRPDRIVVGECRGGEALDMLQAMNTGHDGSLTTTHANSPAEALLRLETLALMAGVGMPQTALREQVARSVHLIVQQARLTDGSRKVIAIVEIAGLDKRGYVQLRPIFEFVHSGSGADGTVEGRFQPTGYLPSFLNEMVVKGLIPAGEPFL